ncbi:MAG: hypothetical protein ACOCXQ_04720 [Patescibacteria group bacterium]
MSQEKVSPSKPFKGDLREHPDMQRAYEQYADALRRVKEGSSPVKRGSKVFRVVGGLKVGSANQDILIGSQVEHKYATPYTDSVMAIMQSNDRDYYYHTRDPFDPFQVIIIIEVEDFEIPKPDLTHGLFADIDQVVVNGMIVEILTPNEFIDYINVNGEEDNEN